MTLDPGLRGRMRRAERSMQERARSKFTFGERLMLALKTRAAMSVEERDAQDRARWLAAMAEPDARNPRRAQLQRALRRAGTRRFDPDGAHAHARGDLQAAAGDDGAG